MASNFGNITLFFILFIHTFSCWAQINESFTSAFNAGMLSSDKFSTDRDVFVLQPSVLPGLTSTHISAHIQSRFTGFGLYAKGLNIASGLPFNFGAGLSILSLGHPDWKSTDFIIGTGKQLSEHASIGISQHVHRSKVGNEGRPWTGTSTASGSYNKGNWGLAVTVSGLMKWGQNNDFEQFSIGFGSYVQWLSQTTMNIALDYHDEQLFPVIGIKQYIMNNVTLFGAFQIYPSKYGLGFSIPLNSHLESIMSTQYHPVLGWSPSIGIYWRSIKDDKNN